MNIKDTVKLVSAFVIVTSVVFLLVGTLMATQGDSWALPTLLQGYLAVVIFLVILIPLIVGVCNLLNL